MHNWLFIFFIFILSSCGGNENPKKLYLADYSSLSSFERQQINAALDLLAEGAGERFLNNSGDRPLYITQAQMNGTDTGYARPRTYECEIGIDSQSDLIRDEPRLIQYVFIHQLGHCYGLPYSGDPDSVMYPTFNGIIDNNNDGQWNDLDSSYVKLKNFAKELKNLSR